MLNPFARLYALFQGGQMKEARDLSLQLLAQHPDHPDLLHLSGLIAHQTNDLDDAERLLRRALAISPQAAAISNNLANVLKDRRMLSEAEAQYRDAIRLDSQQAAFQANLARVLVLQGRLDEAASHYRAALSRHPQQSEWHLALSDLQRKKKDFVKAAESLKQAIRLQPNHPEAHTNLALTLGKAGRYQEAIPCAQKAIEQRPSDPALHVNLGYLYGKIGRPEDAIACYRLALAQDPQHAAASTNLLFQLNYLPSVTSEELTAAYRAWGETVEARTKRSGHPNSPDPDRRLRVGLVSPDFQNHSCAYFIEPLLAALRSSNLEIVCYANQEHDDDATRRLVELVSGWRNVYALNDDELAAAIRQDKIDILVDLAGHTTGHRLPVFARKPAPVQVTWPLGSGATSGLSSIDYFLTDRHFMPAGSEGAVTEQPFFLARFPFVYRPPIDCPEVSPLPARQSGRLTFACLSRPVRINHRVVAVWSRLLNAIPGSVLWLNTRAMGDPEVQADFKRRFLAHGVSDEQLHFVFTRSRAETMAAYGQIDMVLDPFPHNSGTTTFESLWMGVPVITLADRPPLGRFGSSILNAIGLNDWVAQSEDDYVRVALHWSGQLQALAALRHGLRDRMRQSPLRDESGFAREFEGALRGMWQAWCRTKA